MHTLQTRIAYVFTVLSCARSKLKHFVNLAAGFVSTWCSTVCLHKLCWKIGWNIVYLPWITGLFKDWLSSFELDLLLKRKSLRDKHVTCTLHMCFEKISCLTIEAPTERNGQLIDHVHHCPVLQLSPVYLLSADSQGDLCQ